MWNKPSRSESYCKDEVRGRYSGGVKAVCFRCHKEWICPPDRNPRWSWCDDCRDHIAECESGERWLAGQEFNLRPLAGINQNLGVER
jgi:hypothetical protein